MGKEKYSDLVGTNEALKRECISTLLTNLSKECNFVYRPEINIKPFYLKVHGIIDYALYNRNDNFRTIAGIIEAKRGYTDDAIAQLCISMEAYHELHNQPILRGIVTDSIIWRFVEVNDEGAFVSDELELLKGNKKLEIADGFYLIKGWLKWTVDNKI